MKDSFRFGVNELDGLDALAVVGYSQEFLAFGNGNVQREITQRETPAYGTKFPSVGEFLLIRELRCNGAANNTTEKYGKVFHTNENKDITGPPALLWNGQGFSLLPPGY
jgi:hypothetical protein